MRNYRLTRPPRALRGPGLHLDNFALVPASALAYKAQWEEIAHSLPRGSALIITPTADSPLAKTLQTIARLLEAKGHRVATLPAERFGESIQT
jgi:hypothetical protein